MLNLIFKYTYIFSNKMYFSYFFLFSVLLKYKIPLNSICIYIFFVDCFSSKLASKQHCVQVLYIVLYMCHFSMHIWWMLNCYEHSIPNTASRVLYTAYNIYCVRKLEGSTCEDEPLFSLHKYEFSDSFPKKEC